MKKILILVTLSLFLCSTISAFQGGGGEATKKGASKKKADTKKKTSGTKSANPTPPRPPVPPAPAVQVFGPGLSINLGNNVKLELVLVQAGSFQMGSDKDATEKPVHRVTISQPFYLGKYEVTQAQWQAVMGSNPSEFKNCGGNCPVEQVSWDEVQGFIKKLNERNSGYTFRLPTEAEWEYAARAGTTGDYAGNLDEMAWYYSNSGKKTHPAGQKKPNAWGLYDMHGNVFEWVQDWHDRNYYKNSPGTDPQGPTSSQFNVQRGGSWNDVSVVCGAAYRAITLRGVSLIFTGFRLVVVVRGTTIPVTAAPPTVSASQPVETKPRAGDVRAPSLAVDLGNNIKMEFAPVQAGSFQMGSDKNDDEKPLHRVTISQPFYLGKYEVTQAQWRAVMGSNPSEFKNCGGNCPVEQVSWDDAQEFIKRLNARRDGHTYRLPTEAEWEYAARSDTSGEFAGNLDEDKLGWFLENSRGTTHAVGQKKPNSWGLYDMHGNVREWCQDWYDEDYYKNSPATDPQGANSGQDRVLRGGSWYSYGPFYDPGQRYNKAPGERDNEIGFRVLVIART